MKKKNFAIFLSAAAVIACMVVVFAPLPSCSSLGKTSAVGEGTIVYQVSYPYYDGFMVSVLPDEMKMHFKDNQYSSELSSGNYFRTAFNTDCNKKHLVHELKFMNEEFVSHCNAENIQDLINRFPDFTIIETNIQDSIAGYLCNKAIAVFDSPTQPDMDIWYTQDIAISDANWCNQFNKINGVLMAYEIEQFGLRTRFRAVEVLKDQVDSESFVVHSEYKEISGDEMHLKMQGIFDDVLH